MLTENSNAKSESEIRAMIENWRKAFIAKDLDTILSGYADDVVSFDAILQLQFKGLPAYRKHWQACMEMCGGPLEYEITDVSVEASGDLAFAWYLARCGGADDKGEQHSSWMRVTHCLRRQQGQWKIVHEHFSAPFDPASGKAMFELQP